MPTLGFTDTDGIDVGNKYVTKDYVMTWYPDLAKNMLTPQLWTWGYNINGELGTNDASSRSSPGTTFSGGTNWKSVSCGYTHAAAIKTDGTLWTWGSNDAGQLGGNYALGIKLPRSRPGEIISGGTNWKSVSAGSLINAAIKTDGTLWTWGYNGNGQLGNNDTSSRTIPDITVGGGTNWKSVSCGDIHTAAIKTDGTLWTWGDNYLGQLGTGNISNRSSPDTTAGPVTYNWKSVSCGIFHTAAIKTDGTLWTWGSNGSGQLGTIGTSDQLLRSRSSPDITAGSGTNWKSVSCGYAHTAAIKTDGTLWTWGDNYTGQLGTGNTTNRFSPDTTAGGGTNWKSVSAGSLINAAIKTDGTLWTWGYNGNGQLGTGNNSNRNSPGTTAGGGSNWKSVASGYRFTTAISESEGW